MRGTKEGAKTEYGTDLVLRDLTSGAERTFAERPRLCLHT